MKNIIRNTGSINDIIGTEPTGKKSAIPYNPKIEYIISMYKKMTPIIISIHAASLVLDQSMIARKVQTAPSESWVIIKTVCPESIN
jgi:hypothetical protein